MNYIKLFNEVKMDNVSSKLEYALANGVLESFRYGSESFFEIIDEIRGKYIRKEIVLEGAELEFINTDIGKKAIYEGEEVYLDLPMVDELESLTEAEYRGKEVKIGKPSKSSSGKPYKVYVLNEKNNVIVVRFGSGMRAKISDPEARKRYDARHGCSAGRHNDKTKPGYWSCRLPRYAKALGLSYSGSAKWW